MNNNRTPVVDQDAKFDLIEHINQDHTGEVMAAVEEFTHINSIHAAAIDDIFQEGMLVNVTHGDNQEESIFVAFDVQGDMEEQVLYLAYSAMAKQGKPLSDNRLQFFTVTDTSMLTPNMVRLTIQSERSLPENKPGYYYSFVLKKLNQAPKNIPAAPATTKSLLRKYMDIAMLWFIKKQSPTNRSKILRKMSSGTRYYTLQKSWIDEDGNNKGYIDIMLHDESAGSVWAKDLNVGDVITTRLESEDKHDNIHEGQALLVADETAYPALLGILQQWKNPLAPRVIILAAHPENLAYFSDDDMRVAHSVKRITCSPNEQAQHIIAELSHGETIDTTWGGFEKKAAKEVRSYLRHTMKLAGHHNRIRGYWNLDK